VASERAKVVKLDANVKAKVKLRDAARVKRDAARRSYDAERAKYTKNLAEAEKQRKLAAQRRVDELQKQRDDAAKRRADAEARAKTANDAEKKRLEKEAKAARKADEVAAQKKVAAQQQNTVPAGKADKLRIINDDAWHLARRTAHGANETIAEWIKSVGYNQWLELQFKPDAIDDSITEDLARAVSPLSFMSDADITRSTNYAANTSAYFDANAAMLRQATTRRVVFESMVELWRDHFHVWQNSDKNAISVVSYDRTVRAGALGSVRDLFYNTLTHPAMLHYLDNQGNNKALPNQNLGREMLELHSLGAGNFTEDDVKAASRMLTGHSTTTVDSARIYRFVASSHDVQPVVLSTGFTHPNASSKEADAVAALQAMVYHLALHPKMATMIATKLWLRFVSDTPDPKVVAELAKVYLAQDTQIVPVLRTLFQHPAFKAAKGAKWRRAAETMASMLRSASITEVKLNPNWTEGHASVMSQLRSWSIRCGHQFQGWNTPDGYPDVSSHWLNPNIMLNTWNMTETIANQTVANLTFTPWDQVLGVDSTMDGLRIVDRIAMFQYGQILDPKERASIACYLATGDSSKQPPEWTGVGSAAIGMRLKNTVRMVFCSSRMFIR
jgi:uncharacterized protein (DUF1800 family)